MGTWKRPRSSATRLSRDIGEPTAAHHEEDGVDDRQDVEDVTGGEQRRGVDEHDVGHPAHLGEQVPHPARERLGVSEPGPCRDDAHPGHARRANQGLQGDVAGVADVVGDPRALRDVEEVVRVWRAQVGVEHQNALPGFGEARGEVGHRGRLALGRIRGGDQDEPRAGSLSSPLRACSAPCRVVTGQLTAHRVGEGRPRHSVGVRVRREGVSRDGDLRLPLLAAGQPRDLGDDR